MGTDRFKIHDGPCACGAGRYLAFECMPDHPYPTKSRWNEYSIACPACEREYVLGGHGRTVLQFHRGEVEAAKRAEDERRSAYAAAVERVIEEARQYLDEMEEFLKSRPSVAEVWRNLRAAGFPIYGTEQTFRRHFNRMHPRQWMRVHVRPRDLEAVLRLLGRQDAGLLERARAAEDISDGSIPRPVGESVTTD